MWGAIGNFLGSSAFGNAVGLLGAGASIYGAHNQQKIAKKELDFQKDMYNQWNSTRMQNQNNMNNAYDDVFNQNKKKNQGGMLGSGLYGGMQ
ncbi:hypothetical protein [Helicobacter pullorum]|uniref:hypothetical protein n=1 Tax=Helicobacter pullorum TaxID=35818 RepID=UPI00241CB633|nr:hypothetical protein [Helicobacter pullorum]